MAQDEDASPDPTELPPLLDSLPISLGRAREGVLRLFVPELKPLGLTEQQWRILRVLVREDGPLHVGDLAGAAALLGPSIARMLPTLEERGLIERRTDPHDARRIECSATAEGRALVAGVAENLRRQYERIDEELGPGGLTRLNGLLARLADLQPR